MILSYDHATIRALDGKVDLLLTPLGVGDRLADWGIVQDKIQQFDWWQGIEVDGLQLTATPAQRYGATHFRRRGVERRPIQTPSALVIPRMDKSFLVTRLNT